MADLNNINVTLSRSNFDITVKKIDGKITVTDPITVKNQISEIRSIADIPNVNAVSVVDGSTIIYNSNNQLYEIRPLDRLTNLTVSNTLILNHVNANGSIGASGDVLASNGSYVYWTPLSSDNIQSVIAGNGLSGGGNSGVVTLSVNTSFIATLAANSALYANVAQHALSLDETYINTLNVNSATYSSVATNAITSNNSTYAYSKQESQINANSSLYLDGGNWASPKAIGTTTPNTAVFTTVQHNGLIPTQGTNIDQIFTVYDNISVTTEWTNTSINSNTLPFGSYVIQMLAPTNQIHTGILSWYQNGANDGTGDEILLHRASTPMDGYFFLRVYRSANTNIDLVLQIASTINQPIDTYTYMLRRMI